MNDVPNNIVEAAKLVGFYFLINNVKAWELGACASRSAYNDLQSQLAAMTAERDKWEEAFCVETARCEKAEDECDAAVQALKDAQVPEGFVLRVAGYLAECDGYDPDDKHGGLYDVRWSGGVNPEPMGDAWSVDYIPKAEHIVAMLAASPDVSKGETE